MVSILKILCQKSPKPSPNQSNEVQEQPENNKSKIDRPADLAGTVTYNLFMIPSFCVSLNTISKFVGPHLAKFQDNNKKACVEEALETTNQQKAALDLLQKCGIITGYADTTTQELEEAKGKLEMATEFGGATVKSGLVTLTTSAEKIPYSQENMAIEILKKTVGISDNQSIHLISIGKNKYIAVLLEYPPEKQPESPKNPETKGKGVG